MKSRRTGETSDRAPSDDAAERKARRERALNEPMEVRPLFDRPCPSLEVRNPEHRTHYRVLLPAYPSHDGAMCPCPDFARRSIGTCKHLEAAWLYLRDHPLDRAERPWADAGFAQDLWKAWDQRRNRLEQGSRSPRARWREAGRVLIEMAPEEIGS